MVGYRKDDSMTASQKFAAGCVSGFVTRLVTQPMDVIKVKTQLQKGKNTRSAFGLFKNIFQEEGVRAFFHGHNLGQIHSIISISTQFYLYEMATKFVTNHSMYRKEYKPVTTFLCGSLSGCATAMLVSPLEVIRVRQIIVKDQYGGLITGAKAVYASGGFLAFYEGLSASMLQVGLQIGISFTVFTYVQHWILVHASPPCVGKQCNHKGNEYHAQYLILASTVAGSASGFLSKTLTYPLDLAKRRLQISSHKEDTGIKVPATSQGLIKCYSLLQCLKKTLRKDGLRGLYRGWMVTMYKTQFSHKEGIGYRTPKTSQNLQKCSNLFQCLGDIYDKKGIAGLFRGWLISTNKAQVTSMLAFTTYELACFAMRKFVLSQTK